MLFVAMLAGMVLETSAGWQAGLQTVTLSSGSSINKSSFAAATTNVVLSPVMASTTSGWGASTTYVYWGQIYLDGSTYNFAESIDDAVYLKIDGTDLINDANWNATKVGSITRDAGWYDFELRLYNGSGGAGPANQDSWGTTAYGFGYNTSGYTGKVGSNYTFPVDPGDRSLFRYDDGLGFEDNLTIDGFPERFADGQVVPAYGAHSGNAAGANINCSAPAAWTNAAETVVATCTGWKLYDVENNQVLSGVGSSYAYTHPDPAAFRQLVWQWSSEYKVTASAAAGGSVSKSVEWVAEGTQFTAVATPAAGNSFYRWRDGNGKTVSRNASLSVKITEPMALTAEFAGTIYVETAGDDENGDGSYQAPYATVEKGVYSAHDGDTVILGAGDYRVDGDWLYITNAITLKSANGPESTSIYSTLANSKRHVMWMANADAVLSGIKIKDGDWSQYQGGKMTGLHYPGGLYLDGGTVTNCIFYNNRGSNQPCGGALYLKNGFVTSCVFNKNRALQDGNNGQGQGGAINQAAGLVENCVITNNYAQNDSSGGGVYISGGTIRKCLISKNNNSQSSRKGNGIAVVGGLVDSCIITDNGYTLSGSGGVYLSGGTVRNCFIGGNTSNGDGAGVYQTGGILEFCTIAGNISATQLNGGLYLNGSGAVARNNVIFDNGNYAVVANANVKIGSGTYEYNSSDSEFVADKHNVGNPRFVDAAHGDYTLGAGSPAIDSAYAGAEDPTVDVAGNARPKDGDGDGVAAIDMGCYEAPGGNEGALRCAFSVSGAIGLDSCETTLSATAAGSGTDGTVIYKWDIDNDGIFDIVGADKAEVTTNLTEYGIYDVKLVVEAGGDTAEYAVAGAVKVGTAKIYVNAANTEGEAWPYGSPETAASDIFTAFDTAVFMDGVRTEVVIADGTYPVNADYINITKPMYVHGTTTRDRVVLQGHGPTSNKRRIMVVNNADAIIENMTMENGNWYSYSHQDEGCGGVRLISGLVTNCVIRNCEGSDTGGGVNIRGGVMADCEIYGHTAYRSNNTGAAAAGGVYMTGGELNDCVISNNVACNGEGGCGIKLNGNGTIRRCLIADNRGKVSGTAGIGLWMNNGTVERCTIIGNGVNSSGNSNHGGGVKISGGTLRNCLIAGNRAVKRSAGVHQTGGTVENCTIVDNHGADATGSGLYLAGSKAVNRNNIIYGNGQGIDAEAICNIEYSSAQTFTKNIVLPATSGTDNISSDPLFKDAPNGDYHLGAGSPAIDAAIDLSLTEDLDGNERPKDGDGDEIAAPDIGCYEAASADEGPLECSIDATVKSGYNPVNTVISANVSGTGSKGELHYSWNVGSGEITSTADAAEISVTFSDYGYHTVSVTVTAAGDRQASKTVENLIAVGTMKAYVNTTGDGIWPYASPETGSSNVIEVLSTAILSADNTFEVEVDDGEYKILDKWINITGKVYLHSKNGAAATTLRAANPESGTARKIVHVNNDDAVVDGFTFTGGWWDNYEHSGDDGGVVRVSKGVLRNCVVRDSLGGDNGGAADILGGVVTNCVFYNCESCRSTNPGGAGKAGGLVVGGPAFVADCVVSNCYAMAIGGVWLKHQSAVVSNCVVFGCRAGYTKRYNATYSNNNDLDAHQPGGVLIESGTLVNTKILNCHANNRIGGIRLTGSNAKAINCLVAGNASRVQAQGLMMSAGSIINCTIAGNGTNTVSGVAAATLTGGTMVNSIVAGNTDCETQLSASGTAAVSHTYTGETPLFRNPARGNWRLSRSSPCIDAGDFTVLDESKDAVKAMRDLSGRSRLVGDGVDMGCYENPLLGTGILVR